MKIYEYISWLPHFRFSCDQKFVWKSSAYLFIKIMWKKSRQVSSLSMQHGSYFMIWQHIFIDVLVWSCIWKIVEKYCIHALFLAQHKQTLPRNIPSEYSVRISFQAILSLNITSFSDLWSLGISGWTFTLQTRNLKLFAHLIYCLFSKGLQVNVFDSIFELPFPEWKGKNLIFVLPFAL